MKNAFGILAAIALVAILGYYSWKLERRIHYKYAYQGQVQSEFQPLTERINQLEQRVSMLESNATKNPR